MRSYSIQNDRRPFVLGLLMAASVIFSYCINKFLSQILFYEEYSLILLVLPIGSVAIYGFLTWLFEKVWMRVCGIINITGTYDGVLHSEYREEILDKETCEKKFVKREKTLGATITIVHRLNSAKITLKTETSESFSQSVDMNFSDTKTFVIYTYENVGDGNANSLSRHAGTCSLIVSSDGLTGRYYNNPVERHSHGKIEMKKIAPKPKPRRCLRFKCRREFIVIIH